MIDTDRRTGRTTRMLEEALVAAENPFNNVVIVLVAHSREFDYMASLLAKLSPQVKIKRAARTAELPNGNTIHFFSSYDSNQFSHERWSVRHCPIRGFKWDTPTFVDHHALETTPWRKHV